MAGTGISCSLGLDSSPPEAREMTLLYNFMQTPLLILPLTTPNLTTHED